MSRYFVSYAPGLMDRVYDSDNIEPNLEVDPLTEDEYEKIYSSIYGSTSDSKDAVDSAVDEIIGSGNDSGSVSAPSAAAKPHENTANYSEGYFIGDYSFDFSSEASDYSAYDYNSGNTGSYSPAADSSKTDDYSSYVTSPVTSYVSDSSNPIDRDAFDEAYESERIRREKEAEQEFDRRFNMSGRRSENGFSYNGSNIYAGADYAYAPAERPDYSELRNSHEDYCPEEADFRDLSEVKEEEKQAELDYIGDAYRDAHPEEFDYDEDSDYRTGSARVSAEAKAPGFTDFVSTKLTGLFCRLRGNVPGAPSAVTDESEDELGAEVTTAKAETFYNSFIASFKIRFTISLIVFAVLLYVSLGLPIPGMLQSLQTAAAACLAMQLMIMLLCLDVFTGGILNLFRGRPGADSLAAAACLVSCVDALMVVYASGVDPHMPLCAISSLSLIGILAGSVCMTRALRKAFRVFNIGKRVSSITAEADVVSREMTIVKTARPMNGFVRRAEEEAPDEEFFRKASPFIAAIAVLFSVLVAFAKSGMNDFVYILSAFLAPAVPFTALLCFAYPYYEGSCRMFSKGAGVAGWSGVCDIGACDNFIITDSDLFPDKSVEIENVRVFANYDSGVLIAYAGSLILASGSGIASCFGELMDQNDVSVIQVENFETLSGGGLKGMIEGHSVIVGNSDLMRLMNVRIPYKLMDDTCVLLAIDGILYGIFNLTYKANNDVRHALVRLMRSKMHPVFAVRDFNITPELIHDVFDVATDGYDFPPYNERFRYSSARAKNGNPISGVTGREGLETMTTLAHTSKSIYSFSKLNLAITAVSVILGLILMLVKFLAGGGVSLGFILAYMIISAIPVLLTGIGVRMT